MLRQFEFTCLSEMRQGKAGRFFRSQKVILRDLDPRLPWFRSGGFSEKELQPLMVATNSNPLDTLIADMDGIAPVTKAALAKIGLTKAAELAAFTDEELLANEGIGAKSVESIRAACAALMEP